MLQFIVGAVAATALLLPIELGGEKNIPYHPKHVVYKSASVSFYRDGKITASGKPFHRWGYTAASRTLPFGTVLRVTRLDNGKSVRVTVTDRGPWTRGRTLDLSEGAATKLAMNGRGLIKAKVTLE